MTSVSSSTSSSQQSTSSAAAAASAITPDYNMFLQLLTTQMQNQDPLDPMDTSQYTQQLVQYSQVEQEMQQTGTLNNILSSLSSQNMAQASAYIGKEARFDTDLAGLSSSTPATWTYTADPKPASLVASIKDANGNVVDQVTLDPATEGRFSWDGKEADGTQAADGTYTLALAAKDASGADVPVTINSVGIVKNVVSDSSGVMLGVNGARFSMSGLVAVSSSDDI